VCVTEQRVLQAMLLGSLWLLSAVKQVQTPFDSCCAVEEKRRVHFALAVAVIMYTFCIDIPDTVFLQ
jgi:hypothetical protein